MKIGSRSLSPAEVEEMNAYTDEVWAYIDCQQEDEMIRRHSDCGDLNGDCCAGLASRIVSDREDN